MSAVSTRAGVRRTMPVVLVLALALWLAAAATASAFTIKNAKLQHQSGRFVYALTICTSSQATLKLSAKFSTSGVKAARPGSTQYQSKGCWPALVAARISKKRESCSPLECPVVKGHMYTVRVTVKDTKTGRSKSAPVRKGRA